MLNKTTTKRSTGDQQRRPVRSPRPARRRRTGALAPDARILCRTQRGTATLAEIARAAAELQVPVWALLVPGLHQHHELLTDGALGGLEGLVSDYLASAPARRKEIETFARAGVTAPTASD